MLTFFFVFALIGCSEKSKKDYEYIDYKEDIGDSKNSASKTAMKTAVDYIIQNDFNEAKLKLEHLIETYPKSTEARNAKAILQDLNENSNIKVDTDVFSEQKLTIENQNTTRELTYIYKGFKKIARETITDSLVTNIPVITHKKQDNVTGRTQTILTLDFKDIDSLYSSPGNEAIIFLENEHRIVLVQSSKAEYGKSIKISYPINEEELHLINQYEIKKIKVLMDGMYYSKQEKKGINFWLGISLLYVPWLLFVLREHLKKNKKEPPFWLHLLVIYGPLVILLFIYYFTKNT